MSFIKLISTFFGKSSYEDDLLKASDPRVTIIKAASTSMGSMEDVLNAMNSDLSQRNTLSKLSNNAVIKVKAYTHIPVCSKCSGQLTLCTGRYGQFLGCSNYSTSFCKGSMSVPEYILEFIKLNGLNVYGWDKTCWHCGERTKVYTYNPYYDLYSLDDEIAETLLYIALGEFPKIDNYMLKTFASKIQQKYSHTTKTVYPANICQHCGKIQGNHYLLQDPHGTLPEIWEALSNPEESLLDKYLVQNIPYNQLNLTVQDIKEYLWMAND